MTIVVYHGCKATATTTTFGVDPYLVGPVFTGKPVLKLSVFPPLKKWQMSIYLRREDHSIVVRSDCMYSPTCIEQAPKG